MPQSRLLSPAAALEMAAQPDKMVSVSKQIGERSVATLVTLRFVHFGTMFTDEHEREICTASMPTKFGNLKTDDRFRVPGENRRWYMRREYLRKGYCPLVHAVPESPFGVPGDGSADVMLGDIGPESFVEKLVIYEVREVETERRDAGTLRMGQRFNWRDKWYEYGEKGGRPMAIALVPNRPTGVLGTSGLAPPIEGITVDVMVDDI